MPSTRGSLASPPTPLAEAAALHAALSELVRLYQFRDRKRICYYDLSVTQCHALEAVRRLGPLRVDDLAVELGLDKSTASRVVASMEQRGYLERGEDAADGRAVLIRATRRGRELYRRIERDLFRETQRVLAGYPPEAVRSATRILTEFTASARRRFAEAGISCSLPESSPGRRRPSRA